ncbi:GFA family protein [Aliiroseovarius sp.]|uniref:GFA family protein n=1 Tax=Aliiroseovarius sp. TaxID=1872442 RepID=UPI002612660E|nr:GFA family protein [Aliiroseovarius sp.]
MKGHCLCGAIAFGTDATPQGVSMCHCGQCRRQSGGIWSSAFVKETELTITGEVRWFAASDKARRGFCPSCGSFLFWQGTGEDTISFALGAVDNPTDVTLEKHIFTADKGDYYDICDRVEQHP